MRNINVITTVSSRVGMMPFFILPTLFVIFADAILSYTFPVIAERTLGSNTLLGIVMALSSIAGILCDITFPSLFRGKSWATLLLYGISLAILFPLAIHISIFFLPLFFFILASVIWGIYYEMLGFAEQNYVVEEEKPSDYTRAWGIIHFILLFTWIAAPILGALILQYPMTTHTSIILLLQGIAFAISSIVVFWGTKRHPFKEAVRSRTKVSILKNLATLIKSYHQWKLLFLPILPAIVMGIVVEVIEASYWMLGGLFGYEISPDGSFAWAIILSYTVPFILGSLILAKLNIRSRKKYFSQISLLGGAVVLCGIFFTEGNLPLLFGIIATSSFLFSFANPLNDAVYSDLTKRAREHKLYLIGLAKANSSIAYITTPIIMGLIADHSGYYTAFGSLGAFLVLVSVLLLLGTPRKLRLPQQELDALT